MCGLCVPETGIVYYSAFACALLKNIKSKGGNIFFNQKVIQLLNFDNCITLVTEIDTYNSKLVINCGGFLSDEII